jgi:hypothetical protein
MDNLENLIHELDGLSSDGSPQEEQLTFQSKGRGFESPRLHFSFSELLCSAVAKKCSSSCHRVTKISL